MRSRPTLAATLVCLVAFAQFGPARLALAQAAGGGAKQRLDMALAVLRAHQSAAGKSCLAAMTQAHQTEDQVASLGERDSNSNHPDNGADVAHDVLESDYEGAEAACRPDAERVCATSPSDQACQKLNRAAAH